MVKEIKSGSVYDVEQFKLFHQLLPDAHPIEDLTEGDTYKVVVRNLQTFVTTVNEGKLVKLDRLKNYNRLFYACFDNPSILEDYGSTWYYKLWFCVKVI